ncbi:MAG: hypothetical protein JWO79_4700 [Actinomycetia bacterium]|jgi:hypothetical protein|nr:hypothetical protein [Actinomycetes bacterium]MDQ1647538.1 hypothetical protein [Cryptosporangiaceae bacterium]MDQ1654406.1 hypothetical protein [Cryptosporangiaceae bacterium]MDQ1655745.1 hypothetical protein [Cryptosporangiaceae bacterium]
MIRKNAERRVPEGMLVAVLAIAATIAALAVAAAGVHALFSTVSFS